MNHFIHKLVQNKRKREISLRNLRKVQIVKSKTYFRHLLEQGWRIIFIEWVTNGNLVCKKGKVGHRFNNFVVDAPKIRYDFTNSDDFTNFFSSFLTTTQFSHLLRLHLKKKVFTCTRLRFAAVSIKKQKYEKKLVSRPHFDA